MCATLSGHDHDLYGHAPHSEIFSVIGHPIKHSLSPHIHGLFAQAVGVEMTYGRILSPLDGFAACVENFVAHGGYGMNVTLPFKFEALAIATQATPRALLAGAANTLRFDCTPVHGLIKGLEQHDIAATAAKVWWADNTDGAGLVRDITYNAGVAIEGQQILLVGAGGACAGVLGPLIVSKPRVVVVANRSEHKAQDLVARHAQLAKEHAVELRVAGLTDCGQGYDIVINGSSSSIEGAGIPVSTQVLKSGALALDMMYGDAARPFLQWAAEHGAHGRDGLGMLVEQAAESFYFWRGIRPDGKDALEQVRQYLQEL